MLMKNHNINTFLILLLAPRKNSLIKRKCYYMYETLDFYIIFIYF